jgi:hypothetical protein
MQKANRRSAVALGLAAASAAIVKPAASQTTDIVGKDATPWPGVVVRVYSETPAIIPGFKNVQLRDIIMQPGSKTMGPPMMNAMVCHITEGELRIEQEGKTFTAKKNFVWTCNKDTKEQAYSDGNAVGIMRITDLMGLPFRIAPPLKATPPRGLRSLVSRRCANPDDEKWAGYLGCCSSALQLPGLASPTAR